MTAKLVGEHLVQLSTLVESIKFIETTNWRFAYEYLWHRPATTPL